MAEELQYAGAEWIKQVLPEVEMSELGHDVANLLGDLFRGIYHIQSSALKVDWSNDLFIEVTTGYTNFATYDGTYLTDLVILCHDRCIRCEIEGVGPRYLRLRFHRRKPDGVQLFERHPTIEQAVRRVRREFGNGRE